MLSGETLTGTSRHGTKRLIRETDRLQRSRDLGGEWSTEVPENLLKGEVWWSS